MGESVLVPLRQMVEKVLGYLPQLLGGLVILALGWFVAWLAKKLVMRFMIVLRLHRLFERSEWGAALQKGDVRYTFIEGVGNLVFLFFFIVFLDNAIVVWELTTLAQILDRFILYLPRLAAGALILAVGLLTAKHASRRIAAFLEEEDFERAYFIGGLSKMGITLFAVALTLDQIGIAPRVVLAAFLITGGSLGAALVLAFGLGSREAVQQFWESLGRRRGGARREQR